jgi:hypothetical protein
MGLCNIIKYVSSPLGISLKAGMEEILIEDNLEKAEDNNELNDNDKPEFPPGLHGTKTMPVK